MMAKMFYTLEEAQNALGKNEEEIKQFAREGRLREFRDGPRLMFKADQVEQLKSELQGGMEDQVDLGTSDSGGLIGLVDSGPAPSGSGISMADADTGGSSGAGMHMKDDTALAADLGLSGSMGGVPSPGRPASGTGLSGTASGRQSGVNVFGAEDVERVDPSAQTAISGAIREQVNLEGVGSGSGLLDLTRESDDTSLGAVLDEIAPSARLSPSDVSDVGSGSGTGLEDAAASTTATQSRPAATGGAPMYVQAADASAAAFGAAALAAALVLMYGIFVLVSAMVGTAPQAVTYFAKLNPVMPALFGAGVALIFFIIGLLIGKTLARS